MVSSPADLVLSIISKGLGAFYLVNGATPIALSSFLFSIFTKSRHSFIHSVAFSSTKGFHLAEIISKWRTYTTWKPSPYFFYFLFSYLFILFLFFLYVSDESWDWVLWSSQLLLQESPPLPPEAGSHQKWVQKAFAHHRTLGTNQVAFLLVSASFQVWEEIPPHFQGHSSFKNVKGE